MSSLLRSTIPFVLAALCASLLDAQTKKYDVKSGVVTFETTIDLGSTKMTNMSTVFFDDYGMKECRESYDDGKLKESFFSDGKTLYLLIHAEKSAYNRGQASRGTEMKFDWNEISANDKKEGKAKQLPAMTVAGKKCDAYELETQYGKTTCAGYKNVTLYMKLASKGMTTVTKAVKFEENASVPADKFKVPAGYAEKKSPF